MAGAYTSYSTTYYAAARSYMDQVVGEERDYYDAQATAGRTLREQVADAVHSGNHAMAGAERLRVDATLYAVDNYFANVLSERETLYEDSQNARRDSTKGRITVATAYLSNSATAGATREIQELTAYRDFDLGQAALTPAMVNAAAALQSADDILLAEELLADIENTPVADFSDFVVAGIGTTMFLPWLIVGADPSDALNNAPKYRRNFFYSLPEDVRNQILKLDPHGELWQVHHRYQQADAVQSLLQEIKGADFDVHSIDKTRLVPDFVHQRISGEQSQWWRARYEQFDLKDKADFSIKNIIDNAPDKKKLVSEYDSFVRSQDQFYSKYWIKKGSSLDDFQKLAKNFGIDKLPADATVRDALRRIRHARTQAKWLTTYQGTRMRSFLKNLGKLLGDKGTNAARLTAIGGVAIGLVVVGQAAETLANDRLAYDVLIASEQATKATGVRNKVKRLVNVQKSLLTYLNEIGVDAKLRAAIFGKLELEMSVIQ